MFANLDSNDFRNIITIECIFFSATLLIGTVYGTELSTWPAFVKVAFSVLNAAFLCVPITYPLIRDELRSLRNPGSHE